jgi:ATP-dependent RNA helicase DeaD
LYTILEKRELTRVSAAYKINFEEQDMPSDEDVANTVSQRLTALLEAELRSRDKLKSERMQRFVPFAKELAESEEGLQLIAMVLDDTYHESVHQGPSPQTEAKSERPKSGRKSGSKSRGDSRRKKGRGRTRS